MTTSPRGMCCYNHCSRGRADNPRCSWQVRKDNLRGGGGQLLHLRRGWQTIITPERGEVDTTLHLRWVKENNLRRGNCCTSGK